MDGESSAARNAGVKRLIGDLELSDATRQAADAMRDARTSHHDLLRIAGEDILYVHLPAEADAPELMRARLRALDQGRKQFSKRVRKEPKPKPIERFQPIVSDKVVDAYEDAEGFGVV